MTRRSRLGPNKVADGLMHTVRARPGIHFRELGRCAGVPSSGQLRYHLDWLLRHGRIVEHRDGHYRRYFEAGQHDARLRGHLAHFARRVPRQIARALLHGPMNRTQLRRALDLPDSTLGYHLARMVAAGDLRKQRGSNCCNYLLADTGEARSAARLQAGADAATVPPAAIPWPGVGTGAGNATGTGTWGVADAPAPESLSQGVA